MPKQKRKKQPKKPLTEAQKQAAALMFDGEHISQIAAILGVHRTTLWRWRSRRDFQQEINRVSDRYMREKRRAWLKEYHSSPEYKKKQSKKYYARRKLKKISAQLDNAQTRQEHQRLWNLYQKTYGDAFLGGRTPMEVLNSSRLSYMNKKARKAPKYIIEIVK